MRQRELINELDEARKELEEGSRKRKWNFFGRNKNPPKRKDWETYIAPSAGESSSATADRKGDDGTLKPMDTPSHNNSNMVLFDIDAIRAEIENSGKEEQAARDLEKSMSGLQVSNEESRSIMYSSSGFDDRKKADGLSSPTYSNRGYDSYELQNDGYEIPPPAYGAHAEAGGSCGAGRNVWTDYDDDEFDEFSGKGDEDGELKMTFA